MKPKIVTICGSSRFIDIMAVCAWIIERDEKAIVLSLHLLPRWYPDVPGHHLAEHDGCAADMDALHIQKINMSDEIFVVNYDSYIGDSTRREVKHAMNKNIPVRWFTHDAVGKQVQEMIDLAIKQEQSNDS